MTQEKLLMLCSHFCAIQTIQHVDTISFATFFNSRLGEVNKIESLTFNQVTTLEQSTKFLSNIWVRSSRCSFWKITPYISTHYLHQWNRNVSYFHIVQQNMASKTMAVQYLNIHLPYKRFYWPTWFVCLFIIHLLSIRAMASCWNVVCKTQILPGIDTVVTCVKCVMSLSQSERQIESRCMVNTTSGDHVIIQQCL